MSSGFATHWLDRAGRGIEFEYTSINELRWKERNVAQVSKDLGVIAVLAKRMVEERLPKALALKERVDRGEVLNDLDVSFLEQVFADANRITPLMKENPQVSDVAGRMMQLYKEITSKALENEKAQQRT